jgi:hypothetical protein
MFLWGMPDIMGNNGKVETCTNSIHPCRCRRGKEEEDIKFVFSSRKFENHKKKTSTINPP